MNKEAACYHRIMDALEVEKCTAITDEERRIITRCREIVGALWIPFFSNWKTG